MPARSSTTPPGWHPDPTGRAVHRWWDGRQWTAFVGDGRTTWSEVPPHRSLTAADDDALRFVADVFLPEAYARGVVGTEQHDGLRGLVGELRAEVRSSSAEETWTPAAAPAAPLAPALPAATPPTAWDPASVPPLPAGVRPRRPGQPAASLPRATARPTASEAWPTPATAHRPVPRPAAPRPVSAFERRLATLRERVGADVAVHGLAYLGVLMLFVGVFGLVAFAFGEVTPALRPVAEAASALVPFVAARMLLRHGAQVAGRAVEGVAGLILPVMLVTTTVDGFGFPPDLHGPALPVVLAVVLPMVAVAYAGHVRRHPASGLRYAVAPTLWLAAAMAFLGVGRPMPSGEGVAVPSPAQLAAIAVAVLVTAVLARRSSGALAASSSSAVVTGSVVVAVLALATWIAQGWPLVPVAVTWAALVLAWDRTPRVPGVVTDVAAVLGWCVVAVRLVGEAAAAAERSGLSGLELAAQVAGAPGLSVPGALALVVAAAGFLGLVELTGRRARSVPALALAAVGLWVCGWQLVGTWFGLAWLLVAVWAAVRRRRPFAVPAAAGLLDVQAAIAPVLVVLSVGARAGLGAGLLAGAAVVVVAGWPAVTPALGRGADDGFWVAWWRGALAVVVVADVLLGLGLGDLEVLLDGGSWDLADAAVWTDAWGPALAALLLGVAVLRGPVAAVARVWAVTALGAWAWLLGCWAAGAPALVPTGGLVAAGLGLVLAAHGGAVLRRVGDDVAAALGFAGHVLGLAVVVAWSGAGVLDLADPVHASWRAGEAAAPAGWSAASSALTLLLVATGGVLVASLVTALAGERERSPVGSVLDAHGPRAATAPWLITLLAAPGVVVLALGVAGVLTPERAWGTPVAAGAAVAYAAVARLLPAQGWRRLLRVLPWTAVGLGLVALLVGVDDPGWVRVLAVGALPAVAAGLPRAHRPLAATWLGWAAVVPLVALVAWELVPAVAEARGLVAPAAGVVVGGLLAVAELARLRRTGATGTRLSTPPAVVGTVWLVVGLAATPLAPTTGGAAAVVGSAAVLVAALAVLARVEPVGAGAPLLAWVAWELALPVPAEVSAWRAVVVAATLLAAALGAAGTGRPGGRGPAWLRAGLRHGLGPPLALAAVLPAVAALVLAAPGAVPLGAALVGAAPLTPADVGASGTAQVAAAIGLLAVSAAVRLRARSALAEALSWVGTFLVLTGASLSGAGWAALALGTLAVAHTALAARAHGLVRTARQLTGALAAIAAWLALTVHLDWAMPELADRTAVGAGVVSLALVAAARVGVPVRPERRRLDASWVAVWGPCLALLGLVASASAARIDGVLPVVALALLVLAATWSAGLLGADWLRSAGLLVGLGSVLAALTAADASSPVTVQVLVAVSAVSAVAMVALARRGPTTWPTHAGVLGGAALVSGLVVAGDGPGWLSAAVLVGASAQVAAAGIVWRQVGLRLAAPALAWLGWVVAVAQTGDAPVAWYTVAVGVALLVSAAIWRAELRTRGAAPDVTLAALEVAGMASCVVASFVAAFTESIAHAFVVVGVGVVFVLWGVLTRVRRRLVTGGVVVVVGVVVAVGAPLVALLPAWSGAALWVLVAVVGLGAVLAATFLERGRELVRAAREQVDGLTDGWE